MYSETIKNITIANILKNNYSSIKNQQELSDNLGFQVSLNEYLNLSTICNNFLRESRLNLTNPKITKIERILNAKTKGSKKFRKYLHSSAYINKGAKSRLSVCNTISSTNNILDPDTEFNYFNTVHYNFIPTYQRSFFVKFLNNSLLYKANLQKIGDHIDPSCRLCSMTPMGPFPKETMKHLIGECPGLVQIYNELTDYNLLDKSITNAHLLIGINNVTAGERVLYNTAVCFLINGIFRYKKFNISRYENLLISFRNCWRTARGVSKLFDQLCNERLKNVPNNKLLLNTSVQNNLEI